MHRSLYILSVLVLAACSKSDDLLPDGPDAPLPPVEAKEQPMAFSPVSDVVSRTPTPLEDVYSDFMVWAYKHTTSGTIERVIPGYNVLHNGLLWTYDAASHPATELTDQYLKYWDASASYYEFMAVAPMSLPTSYNTSFDADGNIKITSLQGHTTNQNHDIVIARHLRHINDGTGLSDEDVIANAPALTQPTEYHSIVPLCFHHILSTIEFRIYNIGTKQASVSRVDIQTKDPVYTKADLDGIAVTNLTDATDNFLSLQYSEAKVLKTIAPDAYREYATYLYSIYELPQSPVAFDLQVEVNGAIVSGSFDIDPWTYDHHYIYYIRLSVGDGTPILVDIEADDFQIGSEVSETFTNW